MHQSQLTGKLARLLEKLRAYGGNSRSVYAERLQSEIAATSAVLKIEPFRRVGATSKSTATAAKTNRPQAS